MAKSKKKSKKSSTSKNQDYPNLSKTEKIKVDRFIKALDNTLDGSKLEDLINPQTPELKEKLILVLLQLAKAVKKIKDNKASDFFFNQLVFLMKPKLDQMSFKRKIPGCTPSDIYNESLIALKFKAIKDFDPKKSLYFDKFAILCISRHLQTKLKASYQNKTLALNKAKSIYQPNYNNGNTDESLFTADILPSKKSDNFVADTKDKEYYRYLLKYLKSKLSKFEQRVCRLYLQDYSYKEVMDIMVKRHLDLDRTKCIDNALLRIKQKGKIISDCLNGGDMTPEILKQIDEEIKNSRKKKKKK